MHSAWVHFLKFLSVSFPVAFESTSFPWRNFPAYKIAAKPRRKMTLYV